MRMRKSQTYCFQTFGYYVFVIVFCLIVHLDLKDGNEFIDYRLDRVQVIFINISISGRIPSRNVRRTCRNVRRNVFI